MKNLLNIVSLFLNFYITFGELSVCSQQQMMEAWTNSMNKETNCGPRPTIVSVSVPNEQHTLLAPTHVEVLRCQGSCPQAHSSRLSCQPSKISYKEVPIMMSPISVLQGVQETVCTHVKVEVHDTCKCGCHVSPADCSQMQKYNPQTCSCQCDHVAKLQCTKRGWSWDPNLCMCKCPGQPYPTCPTGYVYDYIERCECVPSGYRAFTEIEIVFVIVLLGFICTLLSLAQCYRRRIGLFKHLRSGPSTTLSHVIQTLNIDQTTNKTRVPHMERVDTLKTIEEENIELLSIKKDET